MQCSPLKQLNLLWLRLPVRHRGAVVIAIPALCLITTLASWVWSRETLNTVGRSIDITEHQIRNSDELLAEIVNAETGVRGFTLTKEERFLEPYNDAMAALAPLIQAREGFLQVHPQFKEDFAAIRQSVDQRLRYFEAVINYVRTQTYDLDKSVELQILLEQSKQRMDVLRSQIDRVQDKENALLAAQEQYRQQVNHLAASALWLSAIFSAFGFWAAIYLFTRLDRELYDRQERLEENRSLLDAIVTHVVDGVISLDETGTIELVNPTAASMFGYVPEALIGQQLNQLLTDQTLQEKQVAIAHTLQQGQTWQTMGLRQDHSTFPIAVSISDIQIDGRLVAIIRDMTEVQATQAKLESRATELSRVTAILAQTNAALEGRNKELEQFAYVASHDLKAPLRAIANLSEWIEDDLQGSLPEENQHQMQLLRGRVHRMEALINGLLEYSRVGRVQVEAEAVNVKTLLDDVIDLLGIPAKFTITIGPMPQFSTKALLLRQVFANLISNAVTHHDRPAGTITITAIEHSTHYEFAVADDGPGIDPTYHDKIFAIFQTLEARDTKESTGIGLSIVKKIIEAENGQIWVDSAEGQGSTFRFTWPKTS